ncbi:hypothetical protein H7K45_30835 [Mycobacterium yunnanensis]|uniref:PE-PGRS family protein n=1 Tax=Mycobacterium yunnanensis TaxID=368477 RepID=A0A9X3C649_9MYCO|nr:hypothetical protein [Mycobacterium yunnanensis]MCV7424942.1 hypothetical protein [Mycobacterium yunnanensis]
MSVHVAVRSYLTAGVATVGATALVAAPLAVPPPQIHLPAIHASSAVVDLVAMANPIAEWVTVVQTTFANVAALGSQFQNDPAPILQQILTNQLANAATLATAFEGAAGGFVSQAAALPAATLLAAQQLAAGQFSAAVGTVFQAGIGLILAPAISLISATSVITDTVQRVANVVAAIPNVLLPVGLAALSPIAGAVYSFGDAGQAVIDAARAGDVAGALNALVNIPAIVTNAFLNGYPPQSTTGVFSPQVEGGFGSGLIATLLAARDTFAQALGAAAPPTATATVADLPTAAKLVSLTAAPTQEAQVGETSAKATASAAAATEAATAAKTAEPATEPVTAESTTAATESTTVAATSTPPADTESTTPAASSDAGSTGTAKDGPSSNTKPTDERDSSSTGSAGSAEASSTGGSTTGSSTATKPASTAPSAPSAGASKTAETKKDTASSASGGSGSSSSSGSSSAS